MLTLLLLLLGVHPLLPSPCCPCKPPGVLAHSPQVDKSIIGWHSTVGEWARLENNCVLGEDVQVRGQGVCGGGGSMWVCSRTALKEDARPQ
jgi:hypothetical protein